MPLSPCVLCHDWHWRTHYVGSDSKTSFSHQRHRTALSGISMCMNIGEVLAKTSSGYVTIFTQIGDVISLCVAVRDVTSLCWPAYTDVGALATSQEDWSVLFVMSAADFICWQYLSLSPALTRKCRQMRVCIAVLVMANACIFISPDWLHHILNGFQSVGVLCTCFLLINDIRLNAINNCKDKLCCTCNSSLLNKYCNL